MAGQKEDDFHFLCKIVDCLSEEQRRDIVAFCYNQMSVEEIAKTYRITEEEVKRSLAKARRKIYGLQGEKMEFPLLAAELFFAFGEEAQEVAEGHLKKNKKNLY